MSKIRFLGREEIDLGRWDRCVRESAHTDIYALSGWLDIMAKRWGGLVQGDYAAVLPIPWNRKYFISYVYTPRFTSPLPLCGDPAYTLPLADFLKAIPNYFLLWDLDISPTNKRETLPYTHHHRTNYILSLDTDYESLFGKFRPGYRNLIRQATKAGWRSVPTNDYANLIESAKKKKEIKGISAGDYDRFTLLCAWLEQNKMLEARIAIGPDGRACAGAIFAKTNNKIYYLLAWNNAEGRLASASHLIIHDVVRQYAGCSYTLDFEGSDHPGIAHFFQGFGPVLLRYPAIRFRKNPARIFF